MSQNVFKDIAVVVPAFNEEGNIQGAIDSVVLAVDGIVDDYEIIVIDDGSEDRTGFLAQEKAKDNPRIRIVRNDRNRGFGYSLRKGAELAEKTYTTLFPGDNDIDWKSWREVVKEIGTIDLVVSYKANYDKVSILRKFISKSFVFCMNILFQLNLKYYTGPFVCKSAQMKAVKMSSNGLASIAEYNIRFLKSGCTYKEVPFLDVGRESGTTKALRLRSILRTFKTIFILFKDVYIVKTL